MFKFLPVFQTFLKRNNVRSLIAESWAVSWPMTLILFFDFLIGLADVFIAGILGKEIQAAYGFVFQLYFVFTIIASSLSVGTVSVISRLFTKNDNDDLAKATFSSVIISVFFGIIFAAIAVLFSSSIINSLNVPQTLKDFGIPLMKIYAFGILFHYILINSNGILRASGMIKRSLITMAIVCIVNIALNFYFVFGTPIGFKGIALSTAISLLIGSLLNFVHIKRIIAHVREFSLKLIKRIVNIGWPIGLLQVAWQLGTAVLFIILGLLPRNNVEVIAALTTGLRIESIIFLPAFAFNMANAVVIGNSLGKEMKDETFGRGIVTASIGVLIVTLLTIIVYLSARSITPFLSKDTIVINECVKYLYITLLFEPFMAWGVILGGGLNGAGDTRGVMKIVALSFWLVRLPLSYIFGIVLGFGAVAVWWSMNASILVQVIFISNRYLKRRWLSYAL